jgi:hypothetical protein
VDPFFNSFVRVNVSGLVLLQALRRGLLNFNSGGYAQYAGLRFTFLPANLTLPVERRIVAIDIQTNPRARNETPTWRSWRPDDFYVVGINAFMRCKLPRRALCTLSSHRGLHRSRWQLLQHVCERHVCSGVPATSRAPCAERWH